MAYVISIAAASAAASTAFCMRVCVSEIMPTSTEKATNVMQTIRQNRPSVMKLQCRRPPPSSSRQKWLGSVLRIMVTGLSECELRRCCGQSCRCCGQPCRLPVQGDAALTEHEFGFQLLPGHVIQRKGADVLVVNKRPDREQL